jgi:peptidoglycan/xylan/chitin deacetylase (PgdA/CDA1 family)
VVARLCLTVDNLGLALEVGRGRAARPDPREPGLRTGVDGLLTLFDELGLRSTFFVEGWNGLHHADVIARIAERGHEIGLHGWVHERWAEELDDRAREQLLFDGTAALHAAGADPAAFRAPGGYRGTHTVTVLAELGYRIDSSIDDGAGRPGEPQTIGTLPGGLVSLPWTWDMIDYWQYVSRPDGVVGPDRVAAHWQDLLAAATTTGGLVTLIVHPFVTGVDQERLEALRRVLEFALRTPGIAIGSAGEVTQAYLASARS